MITSEDMRQTVMELRLTLSSLENEKTHILNFLSFMDYEEEKKAQERIQEIDKKAERIVNLLSELFN